MDVRDVLARLDEERRTLRPDGMAIEVLPDVTRLHAADGSHHTVIFSRLGEADAGGAIEREVEHHRALGAAFEWKLYAHDTPADLLERLRKRGFEVGEREAVLACDLNDPPGWIHAGGGIEVRRGDDVETIADYRRVAEAALGKDYSFTTSQLLDALRAGSTQHLGYVAFAPDGRPVSIGRLYTHPASAFGGLYGGATLPAYRGRGYYRATVAARARDALGLGARYLIVDALPTSRPILERLGFRHVTDTWPCEWRPAPPGTRHDT
jgi:hypothetical protein